MGSVSDTRDLTGTCIGQRYRVEAVLGRGGMGAVHRVVDQRTGATLALKQLDPRPGSKSRAQRIALFQHEYHLLSQLAHPNIVEALDYGIADGAPYYTMELVGGRDLKALSPLPWPRACEILLELCSALAVLHARGVVHRDITPRNVLVGQDGHCKLIDFGAMAHMGHCQIAVGTPPYIAPELLQHQHVDGRSDIFSLGGLAYFMLCGRHALSASRIQDLPRAWEQARVPPSEFAPEIPPTLEQLVLGMLSIKPEARPAQVAEVTQRLAALLGREAPVDVAKLRAHLATPRLVGRDQAEALLRAQLSRASSGRGSAAVISGEAGMGRTRMLEAFGTQAKLAGYLVLSTEAREQEEADFAVTRRLLEMLALADSPRAQAAASGLEPGLVGLWPPAWPESGAPPEPTYDRVECQDALLRFFRRLSELVPLAIIVDDAHLADPSSQQLLAQLASACRSRAMLVLASAPTDCRPENHPSLKSLLSHADEVPLEALTEAQTQELLGSVFGESPELTRVAEWAHRVSEGRPRACMELASHLVDRGLARFRGGRFELPSALDALELPQNLEQATRARLASLTMGARTVAELLACVTRFLPLQVDEILETLSSRLGDFETFSALDTLLEARIIRPQGDAYTFVDEHMARLTRDEMSPEQSHAHHRALGELYRARGRDHRCLAGYHLCEAGELEEAYPVMRNVGELVVDSSSLTSVVARAPEGIELYEQMLRHAEREGHSPSTLYRFRKVMLQLSAISQPELSRYADVTLAQLRRDIGLDRWSELAHIEEPLERISQCLALAQARYEETPEDQKGLEPAAAIKEFATCSALLVSTFASMMDTAALDAIPPQLEPLRVLLPVLDIVYTMAASAADSAVRGYTVPGDRERVAQRLSEPVVGMDELTRQGAYAVNCYYIALEHAGLGSDEALRVADEIEKQPVYAVLGKQARLVHALAQGSQKRAERHRSERDMLRALGANCENHLQLSMRWTQVALYRSCDLLNLGRLARELETRAERFPGLQSRVHALRAQIHLLCDESKAALAEVRRGEHHAPPLKNGTWRELAFLRIDALTALGRFEEALQTVHVAEDHLRTIGASFARNDRMAAAEARALSGIGRREQARERLRPMIEQLEELAPNGVPLGELYETLAIVELAAGDHDAFALARKRAERIFKRERHPGLAARYERLRSLSQRSSKRPRDVQVPQAWSTTFGTFTQDALASQLQTQLSCFDERDQLRQLLALVLEETRIKAGYLYRVSSDGKLDLLAHRAVVAPNPHLEAQLYTLLQTEPEDDDVATNTVTGSMTGTEIPGPTTLVADDHYIPLYLRNDGPEGRVVGLLALRTTREPRLSFAFVQAVARTVEALTTARRPTG
ncbi:MAG: protein kinase [Myxococcales bacterium]|nr:protein kinase [Myxococcales bacterium]